MFRGKIVVPMTRTEKVANTIGIISIIYMLVYIALKYNGLPHTIPVHFGSNGQPDRYGSKIELLLFPLINILLFVFLTILERYPHVYNYPQRINEQNAYAFYKNARQLLNYTKNVIAVLFAYITYAMMNLIGQLSIVFWLLLALILVITIVGLIRQAKIQ